MRIAAVKSLFGRLERFDTGGGDKDRSIGSGVVDHLARPLIEMQPIRKHDSGVFDLDDVFGSRLEIVRIGVVRKNRLNADALSADLADKVRNDRRRRHDFERAVGPWSSIWQCRE